MPRDHWVVISDDDLRMIEDGPDDDTDLESLLDWIEDVQDALLGGLETA